METTELKKYQEAFHKIEKEEEINERKKFKKNLILFFIIIPCLLCLYFLLQQNSGFHWSLLPLLGWGCGILSWIFTLPNVDKTLPNKEKEAEKLAGIN